MKRIWRVPAYLPYLQPKLTSALVAEAETKLGFNLPQAYLDLIRVQNGGYIRYGLPDSVHSVIAGIGPYFPSITDADLGEVQQHVSMDLNGLVPFDGDGHWHICLDYRKTREPCVTLLDIECDHETPIADCFSAYLDLLQLDKPDNGFALLDVADIESVKRQLTSALPITFYEADSWAHGYLEHRANCSDSGAPEWLWISPNLVPRGFVRPDDKRYAELKGLLPGMAKRYNNLPDASYILSMTDGVREKITDALRRASIKLSPMSDVLD